MHIDEFEHLIQSTEGLHTYELQTTTEMYHIARGVRHDRWALERCPKCYRITAKGDTNAPTEERPAI